MSMYYYEFLGIITFIIISAVFFVAGYNMRLFSALFIAVLCSYIVSLLIINSKKDLSGDMFLTLTGFILYFFGLLIVQAVIKRSVSLHLVIRPSKESIVKRMETDIKKRINEIEKYRFCILEDGVIKLTFLGKCFGRFLGFVYLIFGMKR